VAGRARAQNKKNIKKEMAPAGRRTDSIYSDKEVWGGGPLELKIKEKK
jgi:hypothetical protein